MRECCSAYFQSRIYGKNKDPQDYYQELIIYSESWTTVRAKRLHLSTTTSRSLTSSPTRRGGCPWRTPSVSSSRTSGYWRRWAIRARKPGARASLPTLPRTFLTRGNTGSTGGGSWFACAGRGRVWSPSSSTCWISWNSTGDAVVPKYSIKCPQSLRNLYIYKVIY